MYKSQEELFGPQVREELVPESGIISCNHILMTRKCITELQTSLQHYKYSFRQKNAVCKFDSVLQPVERISIIRIAIF